MRLLKNFIRDQRGVSVIEYGLIAAILTVATTFAVSAAGYNITDILG
ncbi:Flp family type IVb pilin [Devosia sp. YIM 151766]|nr:Flp family type IVb pilin [Devosia sp. YIM 151766]WIY52804.1 Flp family type IVb pilin [Devosia sp. YIM 151766]